MPQQPKQPPDGYFSGLCVGGPLKGKRLSAKSVIYEVEVYNFPERLPFFDRHDNARIIPHGVTACYEFDRKTAIWWWRGTN
jgi:hypothetical protein